jgi:hypothetical protein
VRNYLCRSRGILAPKRCLEWLLHILKSDEEMVATPCLLLVVLIHPCHYFAFFRRCTSAPQHERHQNDLCSLIFYKFRGIPGLTDQLTSRWTCCRECTHSRIVGADSRKADYFFIAHRHSRKVTILSANYFRWLCDSLSKPPPRPRLSKPWHDTKPGN